MKDVIEILRDSLSDACPEAFCIIALQIGKSLCFNSSRGLETNWSIMVTIGATVEAATIPETVSAANRRLRFFVFHIFSSFVESLGGLCGAVVAIASMPLEVAGEFTFAMLKAILIALNNFVTKILLGSA